MARNKTRSQGISLPTTGTPPIRFAEEEALVTTASSGKQAASARRAQQKKSACKSGCWLTRWIMRFGIFYVLYAALFRCSTKPFSFTYDASHELLVCREMASAQQQLSPALHEFAGKTHAFLEPYAGKYMTAAQNAWKKVSPNVHKSAKHAHTTYVKHIDPGMRALYKQAHQWSLPHQRTAHMHYKKHVHPHVKKMGAILDPYVRTYHKDVHPYVQKAAHRVFDAHDKSSTYYVDKVHPRIKQQLYNAYAYTRHTLFPFAHHHYVNYAHPHVQRTYTSVGAAVAGVLHKYGLLDGSVTNKISETYQNAAQAVDEQLEKAGLKDGSVTNKISETYKNAAQAVDEQLEKAGLKDGSVTNKISETYKNAAQAVDEQLEKAGLKDGSVTNKVSETYQNAAQAVDEQLEKAGLKDGSVVDKVQEAAYDAYEKVDDAVDHTLKEHGLREKTVGEEVADGLKDAYQRVEDADTQTSDALSEKQKVAKNRNETGLGEGATNAVPNAAALSTNAPSAEPRAAPSVSSAMPTPSESPGVANFEAVRDELAEADVEGRAAATSDQIDPVSGERMDVMQARLDDELNHADEVLSEQERAMSMLTDRLQTELLSDVAEGRRIAFTHIPARLQQAFSMSVDHGISGSFLRTVRAARAQASDPSLTPEQWKENMETRLSDEVDVMVDVYEELRQGLGQVMYAGKKADEAAIQKGVDQVRAKTTEALNVFYRVIEDAEFQRTYYEYQGWDTMMKRNTRQFREAMHQNIDKKLTLTGEPSGSSVPDLDAEVETLRSAVSELFKRAENAFSQLSHELGEHPSRVLDPAQYSALLVYVHEQLDALAAYSHDVLLKTTLRLRDDIYNTREQIGLPRVPTDGLLYEVAAMQAPPSARSTHTPPPPPVPEPEPESALEAEPISAGSTPTLADGDQIASILPIDVGAGAGAGAGAGKPSEAQLPLGTTTAFSAESVVPTSTMSSIDPEPSTPAAREAPSSAMQPGAVDADADHLSGTPPVSVDTPPPTSTLVRGVRPAARNPNSYASDSHDEL